MVKPLGGMLLVLGILALPSRARAQGKGDAAFLFSYRAKPDMGAAFAQGYGRHLTWHAEHGDSLTWLAWTVLDGPAPGAFVDGTFGLTFKAFDDRVDPKGDAADAAQTVTAYAEPLDRQVYRLRRDLSPATRLEAGKPAPMQKVLRLTLQPGMEPAFERALRTVEAASRADYAVYESVSGGAQPGYLLVMQFTAWGDLENPGADPGRALLRAGGTAVARAEAEVWLYRPELSYFPRR